MINTIFPIFHQYYRHLSPGDILMDATIIDLLTSDLRKFGGESR